MKVFNVMLSQKNVELTKSPWSAERGAFLPIIPVLSCLGNIFQKYSDDAKICARDKGLFVASKMCLAL